MRTSGAGHSANFGCRAFCELRLACMGMRGLYGKSIMGSGERGHPLHRSGRKEYASCPMRKR